MSGIQKKNNDRFFEVIPKIEETKDFFSDKIIKALQEKRRLKEERVLLIQKKREIHKEIYNLSIFLDKQEEKIARLLERYESVKK